MKAGRRIGLVWAALVCTLSFPVRADLETLRASAEKGDAVRQLELGELYEFGFRMDRNLVPALAWYILSAEQGNAKAASRRDQLRARMTADQVAAAEAEAARLRPANPVPAPPPNPALPTAVTAPAADTEAQPLPADHKIAAPE